MCFAFLGSHNAITYCLDKNDRSPVDLTQPDVLQKLDKYMKPLIRPFVYKWAIAQVGYCNIFYLSRELCKKDKYCFAIIER